MGGEVIVFPELVKMQEMKMEGIKEGYKEGMAEEKADNIRNYYRKMIEKGNDIDEIISDAVDIFNISADRIRKTLEL